MIDKHTGSDQAEASYSSNSSVREKVLEYHFLAAITRELIGRGIEFNVLRGDVDFSGSDLVIEANGYTRHIQLKGMITGGKCDRYKISNSLRLATSGCVVRLVHDPLTFEIVRYDWFGASAGSPLPWFGNKSAKHSKGDSNGEKKIRPKQTMLLATRFEQLATMTQLVDRLFTPEVAPDRMKMLKRALQGQERHSDAPGWADRLREGYLDSIPADIRWDNSHHLATLIDGYGLAKAAGCGDPQDFEWRQLTFAEKHGHWRGDAVDLWVTLYLEQRRWYYSSPFGPDGRQEALLDVLCAQLRFWLMREMAAEHHSTSSDSADFAPDAEDPSTPS
ncbi:MAG: hypothetical protein Q8R44_10180 [Novosphingobium sp.]|nr:hypothetical protein [Novosphingobium sp.]